MTATQIITLANPNLPQELLSVASSGSYSEAVMSGPVPSEDEGQAVARTTRRTGDEPAMQARPRATLMEEKMAFAF